MRTKKTLILMLLMVLMASPMLSFSQTSEPEEEKDKIETNVEEPSNSVTEVETPNDSINKTQSLDDPNKEMAPQTKKWIPYVIAGGALVLVLLVFFVVRGKRKQKDDEYDPDEPESDGDDGKDDENDEIDKLRKENENLNSQLNVLKKQVFDNTSELASVSRERNELKEQVNKIASNQKVLENSSDARVQNALNKVNEAQAKVNEFQAKLNEAQTKVDEAQAKVKEANDRAEKAEQTALAKFDQTKREIEEACNQKIAAVQIKVDEANAKVEEAQAQVQEANQKVEAARQESKIAQENALKQIEIEKQKLEQDFQDKMNHWIEDRNSVLNKLKDNVNRLAGIVEQFNPDAFNGNCAKIRSGITGYANSIQARVDGDQWKQKKLGECLQELRQECCRILDSGSDSWMNLLGRLYSYMSVSELEQKLSVEDLSFDLVSDAYVAMQSVLASVGIVVMNCSPGFDSSDDPVTAKLFVQKSSVDRITNWLNDDMPVNVAIPNHSHTVYDFGQLAYITIDDMEIHQGSVIYYNS